jgi:hypothetical protein
VAPVLENLVTDLVSIEISKVHQEESDELQFVSPKIRK